jgi:hypothetical protein
LTKTQIFSMSNNKIDFKDLWDNWPYYVYDISAKSDPSQHNELNQL